MAVQHGASLPPAQPTYVLRGHDAQIHSVCFARNNTRLLTGDADGWVVLWTLVSKRPVAVWRAHAGAILGLASWDSDKLITHGRDSKLLVWQLLEADEPSFSSVLPIEDALSKRHEPWLSHALTVNTINFCSFSACEASPLVAKSFLEGEPDKLLLVAVPSVHDGDIAVYSLPGKKSLPFIRVPKDFKTGESSMVMCLKTLVKDDHLIVIAGYESGHSCLWQYVDAQKHWKLVSTTKAHDQPVLSLDVAPTLNRYFTSAADAIVAAHSLTDTTDQPIKAVATKHAGQQSLKVRSDAKIFATAGWDGRLRVYSVKTMRELAVLRWHNQGCYSVSFADLTPQRPDQESSEHEESQCTTPAHQTVGQTRSSRTQATHWLAAGSKDGKVSLWDIY